MTATTSRPDTGPHPGPTARERREAKRRRRRATRATVVVAGLVVAGAACGGGTWRVVTERETLAEDAAAAQELLDASEGKVAEPAVRDVLSQQVDDAGAVLDAIPVSVLVTGTGEERVALVTASDAVRTSMLDLARDEVEALRAGLATVVPDAEGVLAVTEGLGADAARAELQAALDAASASEAVAVRSLAGTDVPALEQAEADLAARRDGVVAANEALLDAQDAVTCPAPDQEWSPRSGHLDAAELAPIPWDPSYSVRADLVPGLVAMDAAYQQAFGGHLKISSAYRTFDDQLAVYDPSSPIAAPPGCSNHGLGVAADFGGGVQTFGSAKYTWLKANAGTHGWEHPSWAEPGGRVPEPWHWQSVLAPEATR
ncbi:M15 family metallopeptidase [Antribacter sp. KLBMP9083]|uniref:M15 family metallopeptidase n=1 Tax=Antribacter soli TaxID=2910976 RepID=A0AA41QDI9_9MICO|nr:M15 family metallopeptidase [Antribacter soli]MCF4121474.1 M15 family metallopeptidase [Antribacter soli]